MSKKQKKLFRSIVAFLGEIMRGYYRKDFRISTDVKVEIHKSKTLQGEPFFYVRTLKIEGFPEDLGLFVDSGVIKRGDSEVTSDEKKSNLFTLLKLLTIAIEHAELIFPKTIQGELVP